MTRVVASHFFHVFVGLYVRAGTAQHEQKDNTHSENAPHHVLRVPFTILPCQVRGFEARDAGGKILTFVNKFGFLGGEFCTLYFNLTY